MVRTSLLGAFKTIVLVHNLILTLSATVGSVPPFLQSSASSSAAHHPTTD